MAKVHVSNVVVLNNPATFYSSFQFEITFECIEELKEGKVKVKGTDNREMEGKGLGSSVLRSRLYIFSTPSAVAVVGSTVDVAAFRIT